MSRLRRIFASRLSRWWIGAAYFLTNDSDEPSSPGLMKLNRFHSSPRWFSIGVPVVIILKLPVSPIAARERMVSRFLMACASSSTIVCH